MPPHELYIEAFVGSGAIFRNKRPAKASIVIDIDADVARYWRQHRPTSTTVICGDARSLLRDRTYTGRELVYCDPPYPRSTRRWQFPLYRHEMTDKQHRELLATLKTLPCSVMISGYRCALYDRALAAWHRIDYLAPIHRPPHFAVESLWFNYELQALHDWRYLGNGFRERERIKRKQSRWRRRLSSMPAMERLAMLDLLLELATSEAASPPGRPESSETASRTRSPKNSSPGSRQGRDRDPSPHSAIRFFSEHPPPPGMLERSSK